MSDPIRSAALEARQTLRLLLDGMLFDPKPGVYTLKDAQKNRIGQALQNLDKALVIQPSPSPPTLTRSQKLVLSRITSDFGFSFKPDVCATTNEAAISYLRNLFSFFLVRYTELTYGSPDLLEYLLKISPDDASQILWDGFDAAL